MRQTAQMALNQITVVFWSSSTCQSFVLLPCPVWFFNIYGIDRVAFKGDLEAELCSLVNLSTDQYNATLRSVLDKHVPAAKRKVTNSVIALVQFGQR